MVCNPRRRKDISDAEFETRAPDLIRINIFCIHLLRYGGGADQILDRSSSSLEALPRRADPTYFCPWGREVNMEHAPCPRCGADTTVVGWSDTSDQHRSFQPDGIHWLRHLLMHLGETTQIHLPDRYRACLECGLIWNSLPPEQLARCSAANRWPSAMSGQPR